MRFSSYHPAINLIFFIAVITAAVSFDQPIFLAISYLCPWIYSVVLNGQRAWAFNLVLIPLVVLFSLFYSAYRHFGVTVLAVNWIGNRITLESLLYGLVIGIKTAAILMWFSCVHATFTSDKVIYLFGRVAPKLSLFLSILLRMIPHIKAQVRRVHTAQQCIGRGMNQGSILRRIQNFLRIQSITITWAIENFAAMSDAMRSRGYTLKGRTAYALYRFDYRDRSFVIMLFSCLTVLFMGVMLDQTRAGYNPEIIINQVTPVSLIFYSAYLVVALLPMTLQIIGEYRFKKCQEAISSQR